MQIPLIATAIINHDTQYLEIWRNSRKEIVLSPFLPYFLSTYKMTVPCEKEEIIQKKVLSTLTDQNLYKYSFSNTQRMRKYAEDDSIEADIAFPEKILVDNPDFFTKFANTEHLKIMHFDIEVSTSGMFPTPKRNAIIGIGCKCGDQKRLFIADTADDDREILEKFGNFITEVDPDIISHYNGNFFDIPYVTQRLELNMMPTGIFSRNGTVPSIYDNKHTQVRSINLGGRICFDIYNEVKKDQTLYGIKNLKMKTVAKWIDTEKKLNIKEIPLSDMRSLVGTDTMKTYLQSDVLITEFLFNIYFKNVLMLAEMNKVPLNTMVNAPASLLPQLVHGRAFNKLGIVADRYNAKRHKQYITNKQGALVNTMRPGLYMKPMYKVDFASQYPRVVQTFNISPDVVKLIRYDTYTGKYNFIRIKDTLTLSIPDDKSNVDAVIEIDLSKRGFLAQFMDDVLGERFAIKKKMKTLDKNSTEYQYLHVRQNALKVTANIQTGYHGQEFAKFGDLTCYRVITGMGRYYAQTVIDYLGSPVAVDTDGIYHDQKPNIDDVNKMLDDITMKNFGLVNHLHMELDSYDAAYFRKTRGKHYVLKDGDKILLHGQSMKGSHMPAFFDTILEQACKDMFAGKDVRKNIDVTKFSIEDIMQSKKVKDKDEYKDDSSLSMNLIKQAEEQIGEALNESEQISYIKTRNGYEIIVPGKQYGEIDWNYYKGILEKIYERLGIEDRSQMRF